MTLVVDDLSVKGLFIVDTAKHVPITVDRMIQTVKSKSASDVEGEEVR